MKNSAFADRETAQMLAKRLPAAVTGMEVHPTWAPNDSALYINEAEQILRIDPETGKSTLMIDFKKVEKFTGYKTPRIERFTIAENGDFICLVTDTEAYTTIRITHSKIETVAPENDPFALEQHQRYIPRSGANGPESAIIFINNTDQPAEIQWVDSAGLPTTYTTIQPGKCYRQHSFASHAWKAAGLGFVAQNEPGIAYLKPIATPALKKIKIDLKQEPQQKWQAFFRDYNLIVKKTDNGSETPLTTDGTAEHFYGGRTQFSPNGRYLIAMHETPGDERTIDLIEAAPADRLQPRTVTIAYDKPGDRIAQSKPVLFDLKTMEQIPLDDSLFPNPWDVSDFHWDPQSERFFFIYNERGHQIVRLLAVEAKTGKVAVVAEEKSDTFIDWTNKISAHHLDQTDEVLWMSQRSGWNHLYLINRKTGKTTPITKGEWLVRSIEKIDEENRTLLLRIAGIYPDQDPYYIHYLRVGFDGSNPTLLTQANGTHVVNFSPEENYYVDTYSRVNLPPVHELHRASDGQKTKDLGKADITEMLKLHPNLPEPFIAKGRDGTTDIYGVIYRPSNFDPNKKYPVVEDIYAGPQDFFVPKAFSPWRGLQRLAELGFIVVKIDGMGTNWRSKAFHDVCYKNLKDAGFPDRIGWMKAAAEKYPYMDLSRVGIYGSSAGGQNAMRAVLDHADFYKAAYADCGCHDNRMDKIWWNEQWMGWPLDESYIASSNMEDAHKLGGALFLTVGMMDSNVDPSSTYQCVEELIKADKDFEFMAFPSGAHGAGMGTYGTRLRENFFIRHLHPKK